MLTLTLALTIAVTAMTGGWRTVAPGVDYQEFVEGNIDVHVTRIDLTNDNLAVIVTRESEKGLKVSDYARKNKAIVAVNGDYFDDHFNPIGLTVGACGRWVATRDTAREGIVAIGDHHAEIRPQAEVMDPPEEWIDAAVSGWPLIVRDCAALEASKLPGSDAFTRTPHPRTAAGVDDRGHTLYLVVADGRRVGVPGLTLAELAAFMKTRLDVCWAMNLDGGGSAAMWVRDRIVTRPSDGVERGVGDHIAVVLKTDVAGCDAVPLTRPVSPYGTGVAPRQRER